jgi:hypothetical protein
VGVTAEASRGIGPFSCVSDSGCKTWGRNGLNFCSCRHPAQTAARRSRSRRRMVCGRQALPYFTGSEVIHFSMLFPVARDGVSSVEAAPYGGGWSLAAA